MYWAGLASAGDDGGLLRHFRGEYPALSNVKPTTPFFWNAWWWTHRHHLTEDFRKNVEDLWPDEHRVMLEGQTFERLSQLTRFSLADRPGLKERGIHGISLFEGANGQSISISDVIMPAPVDFQNSRNGHIDLFNVTFCAPLTPTSDCSFGNLHIENCRFHESMCDDPEHQQITFENTTFGHFYLDIANNRRIHLVNCHFEDDCVPMNGIQADTETLLDLRGSVFEKTLNLSGLKFHSVPQLEGAQLPPDVRLPESPDAWPPARPKYLETVDGGDMLTRGFNDRRSYEVLRKHMTDLERHYLRHLFMRREYDADLMWAQQQKPRAWATWFSLGAYKLTSDYGNSIVLPLIWWLLFGLFFTLLHTLLVGGWFLEHGLATLQDGNQAVQSVGIISLALTELASRGPIQHPYPEVAGIFAPRIALQGMFPLGFEVPNLTLSIFQQVFVYLHKTISTTLFFLFGLGVRNRIKMT